MMSRRRVLFVIDSLSCGGAEKSLVSLLPLLDYNKVVVDLLLIKRGGEFEKYIPKDVSVVSFSDIKRSYMMKLKISFFKKLYSLKIRTVYRYSKRHYAELYWKNVGKYYDSYSSNYDVVIAYQQGFPTYYVSNKVNAIKKFCWVNADLLNVGYLPSFNKPIYDSYDGICAVSDSLGEKIVKDGFSAKRKIHKIYDIINASLIVLMSKEFTIVQREGINILTVGRLVPPKGHDLAIGAAIILRKLGYAFHWTFVGEGTCRGNIEKLIRNNNLENYVELVGLQINPYPYMKACDIYVQTSRYEGFGLTITEAKILNKPIVSTNFDVVYNQLQDGVNGLIAEMSAESIANKIVELIENKSLKESLIKATKQEVNTTSITEPKKVMELIMS